MKVIDLFSGGGGLSLGAHLAGFETAKAVELDANLSLSYKLNFPKSEIICADVNLLDAQVLKPEGRFGLIGGPPCQGFSSIGKMHTLDPRRSLVSAFCEKVRQLQPDFFVFENVTGLLFDRNVSVLEAALEKIPSRYKVADPIVLNAADFGVPTDRRRVFVIGYVPGCVKSFDVSKLNEKKVVKRVTVQDAFEGLDNAVDVGVKDGFDFWKISNHPKNSYAQSLMSKDHVFTGNKRTVHKAEVQQRFLKLEPGETDRVGRHKKLSWDGLSPTLRAGTGSDKGSFQSVRPLHPVEPRVITVREAARLQGFPDSHLFHPTVWHSFRMIGNSVPPKLAQAVLKTIKESIII